MDIDPRVVSTPLGAVLGLVLTRKILKPEERSPSRMALGTGIGAGAGLLTGQFIKGDPFGPSISGKSPDRRYVEGVLNGEISGPATMSEAEYQNRRGNIYGKVPVHGGGVVDRMRRSHIQRTPAELAQRELLGRRLEVLDLALKNPSLSERSRAALQRQRNDTAELRNEYAAGGALSATVFGPWDTAKALGGWTTDLLAKLL